MAGFVSALTTYIAAHPHLAYAAVLLLAFSESFPLIGAAVPGSGVIIAVSALVPSGTLKLWPLIICALAGAIAGDGFSFWLGRHYGRRLVGAWPLRQHPELVAKSETFIELHGRKSVFLARFTPGVRAVVPLFAGILRMSAPRFYVANLLSALIWAPAHIVSGVFIGASFGYFGEAAKSIAILAAALLALIWIGYHLLRWVIRAGPDFLSRTSTRVHAWLAARPEGWAKGLAGWLERSWPVMRRLLLPGLLVTGAAWLFLGILEDVVNGDPLVQLDKSIFRTLQDLRSPPADAAMLTFTEMGDTVVVIAITAAVFLWLAWQRAWRTAGYWVAAVASASALNTVIKLALHRARPTDLYTGSSAFSFPSGHSTTNAVLYGFLAYLAARGASPRMRSFITLVAATLVLLIAVSRLYLGAHWFSDVAGGLAFGSLLLTVFIYAHQRGDQPQPQRDARRIAIVGFAALAIAGGANIYLHHGADSTRYAVRRTVPAITGDVWWADGWASLPAFRTDVTGEAEEPFSIQWAGSLADLQAALQKDGWHPAPPWTIPAASGWLTADRTPAQLPAFPRFEVGQPPALTLLRVNERDPQQSRYVMRVWPSPIAISTGGNRDLWLISIVEERFERRLSLFTQVHSAPAPGEVIAQAAMALPESRSVSRPGGATPEAGSLWLARTRPGGN